MNTSKKIVFYLLLILFFGLFNLEVKAITSRTTWNASTEELVYSYEASVSGIRRIWLECSGPNGNQVITLYVHGNGFTTQPVTGTKDTNNLANGTYVCKAHVATEGDNDDREGDGDITFTKVNGSNSSTSGSQQSGSRDSCIKLVTEEDCVRDGTCLWNSNTNTCGHASVAARPCDEPDIRKVLKLFGYFLLIARVFIPLIIIGFGTFDLFKSVIDKDEKSLTKQLKQLGVRIVAGFIVFLIPSLVNVVFSLSDALDIINTDQYQACATCLLDTSNCDID